MSRAHNCLGALRHYEVVSPIISHYVYGEPPYEALCWGLYLAPSVSVALAMAVADPEFGEWVKDARADRVPPFKGLKATLYRCEHGVCVECSPDDAEHGDEFPCPRCKAIYDADMEGDPWISSDPS